MKFIDFTAVYSMSKCLKTMVCGLVMMGVIFCLRLCSRKKNAHINFYAMFLLFPMVFTGMSRIFYLRGTVWITGVIYMICTPVLSKLYFGVAGILFVHCLRRNRRLKKYVKGLAVFEDRSLAEEAKALVYKKGRGWGCNSTKIYVTDLGGSPFSGGIVHPFIVLPRQMTGTFSREQLRTVLCHEMIHIRWGHLVWLQLFELLCIYWWANPLIHLCRHIWRQDMELVCDESSTFYGRISAKQYGELLLNTVQNMRCSANAGVLSLFAPRDYRILKKRILHLGRKVRPEGFILQKKCCMAGLGICLAAAGVLIAIGSYPRYTSLDAISLYNEQLELVVYDSPEIRQAVQIADGRVFLDEALFQEILKEKHVVGEYVYVGFGGVMKVPGVGGGGDAAMISTTDYSDIFYLRADTPENDLMEFMLKYM